MKKAKRYVVITTDKKGVFFGVLDKWLQKEAIAILKNAKMCIYWSADTKGVLGLAGIGPQEGSRLTPEIPQIELNGVTSIMDCTKEAVKQWKLELWN